MTSPPHPTPLRSGVSPEGRFLYGIHKPSYLARNVGCQTRRDILGRTAGGQPVDNQANFPSGDINVTDGDWVYEVPNAFPFKGCTLIARRHAEQLAENPQHIRLPAPSRASFSQSLTDWLGAGELSDERLAALLERLPPPLQLALATSSANPRELVLLARHGCRFLMAEDQARPVGLEYAPDAQGNLRPIIHDHLLYDALANNPHLPDSYKQVMVLRPGAQGTSPIVGEWPETAVMDGQAHIYEYLRTNSYIPGGHYAANLADDTVGYHINRLTPADMQGLRHLYYQRTWLRMAAALKLPEPKDLTPAGLEALRLQMVQRLATRPAGVPRPFTASIWGWNYGFDLSSSRFRLNASHQQIHQQYALVPGEFAVAEMDPLMAPGPWSCGDLIADFVQNYENQTRTSFFDAYLQAIFNNRRMDGNPRRPQSLVVHADEHVTLFVPKAQTSQWELQLLPLKPVAHILQADTALRASLDYAIWLAITLLTRLGATLITSVEYGARFDDTSQRQRLLYCFLPRLPMSPGAFSETQMRWICRHYPEDFAEACRRVMGET